MKKVVLAVKANQMVTDVNVSEIGAIAFEKALVDTYAYDANEMKLIHESSKTQYASSIKSNVLVRLEEFLKRRGLKFSMRKIVNSFNDTDYQVLKEISSTNKSPQLIGKQYFYSRDDIEELVRDFIIAIDKQIVESAVVHLIKKGGERRGK